MDHVQFLLTSECGFHSVPGQITVLFKQANHILVPAETRGHPTILLLPRQPPTVPACSQEQPPDGPARVRVFLPWAVSMCDKLLLISSVQCRTLFSHPPNPTWELPLGA